MPWWPHVRGICRGRFEGELEASPRRADPARMQSVEGGIGAQASTADGGEGSLAHQGEVGGDREELGLAADEDAAFLAENEISCRGQAFGEDGLAHAGDHLADQEGFEVDPRLGLGQLGVVAQDLAQPVGAADADRPGTTRVWKFLRNGEFSGTFLRGDLLLSSWRGGRRRQWRSALIRHGGSAMKTMTNVQSGHGLYALSGG
jgi:hypothetical protein